MDNLAHLLKSSICLAYRNGKRSLIEVPGSAASCFRTLNNKNTQYVVVCDHIGDFLITLGYLKEFKERYHYDHITLCIAENLVEILDLYPKVWDTLLILKKRKLYQLLSLGSTNFGIHILNKLKNITLVNPADAFVEEDFANIIRYPTISFQDCIRFGCLKLQEKDLFHPPEIINRKFDTHNKKNIKKVIICPDARFIQFEKSYHVGPMIKACGLIGFAIGDAEVSTKHADFVVNNGNASCEDVLAVLHEVQRRVKEKFGVHIPLEVRMLGEGLEQER